MIGLLLVNFIAVPSFHGNIYETIRFTNHPNVIFLTTLYNWILTGCVVFLISGILFLIVYGLIGLLSIATFLIRTTSRTWVELTPNSFQVKRWMLGLCYWNVREQFADTTPINLDKIKIPLLRQRIRLCSLKSPRRKHWLGIGLSGSEQKWLVREIREFLRT